MSFKRMPTLTDEQLTELKPIMSRMWEQGLTMQQILNNVQYLPFGRKLTIYLLYNYRADFGLPPRIKRKKGRRYKDKKEELMEWEDFIKILNNKLPPLNSKGEPQTDFCIRRKRAYLILQYWTPLRKSEIYDRTVNDFETITKNNSLKIHLRRKKKKYRYEDDEEPLEVPLAFPYMDEVVAWIKFISDNDRKKEAEKKEPVNSRDSRVFNISANTAWNYVRDIFEGYYPHFFRFNYITDAFTDPNISLSHLTEKTGLHVITLNNYLMNAKNLAQEADRRKLDRLGIKQRKVKTAKLTRRKEPSPPIEQPETKPRASPFVSKPRHSIPEKKQPSTGVMSFEQTNAYRIKHDMEPYTREQYEESLKPKPTNLWSQMEDL